MAHPGRRDGVLARLSGAVGQVDEHRHVLSGRYLGQAALVVRFEHERDDISGLLDPTDHAIRPGRLVRVDARLGIQPGFFSHQLGGEEPVHLVPGGADFRCNRLTKHVAHGAEEIPADDGVLLGSDAQRDVL